MDKIQKIKELLKELNQYRQEYYNLNKPSVNDATYDLKFDELSKLEKECGFVMSNSPTITVGYEVVSKLQKVEHPIPLKSLDKTKSIDELIKWTNNKEIILMLKADGLTVELLYENHQLIQASTRGNSLIGEDITSNAKVFKNIPLSIPFKGKLRIAGEAIIHRNDFKEINSKLPEEEKYATPRNLCAGSCRQLNSKVCAERNVHFYAFNILECSEELTDSKRKNFVWLANQGFINIGHTLLTDLQELEYWIKEMKNIAEEENIPIDGMVISYNSISYSQSLGEVSHHPLYSIAYKFSDETEETVLRDVEWRTTRTGQVNPTAIFDTVILDNTEVSRASLFNLTFIKEMQLNINSRIKVAKRNMIIPYIEENLDILQIPSYCPACGSQTVIKSTGTADFLYCVNDNCFAKLLDKFVHLVKRDCVNIEGLSSASLELFIKQGFLRTFDNVFKLDQYRNKIIKLEGWGVKSYNNLIKAIENSRKVKCANFIYSLGIPNIGISSSKVIAKHFNNDFQAFLKACDERYDFSVLTDFGDITNQSIHDWYRNKNESIMWMFLLDEVEIIQEEKKEGNNMKDLTGINFVITGAVNTFKNRDEFKQLVESLNGKVAGSVSTKTNYLVNNDTTSTTGKNQKAKQLNIPIISEAEFNEMVGR